MIPAADASRALALQAQFERFRAELDDYNDRRDRLIKASRDVTTASKRLIFMLHRYPHDAFPARAKASEPSSRSAQKLLADAKGKQMEIVALLKGLAAQEQLVDDTVEPGRATRHDRAIGGGIEEFIEAITFLYFLEHGQVMTLDAVQQLFVDDRGARVLPITPQRYLLGLSDLTGELMRFATNAIGAGDTGQVVLPVLETLRNLMHALDPFVPLIRDFRRKQQVTAQSTRKIEDISYAIKVRSAEFSSDPAAVREMLKRALASSATTSQSAGYDAEGEAVEA